MEWKYLSQASVQLVNIHNRFCVSINKCTIYCACVNFGVYFFLLSAVAIHLNAAV